MKYSKEKKSRYVLSEEEYLNYKTEIDTLKNNGRKKISRQIKEIREAGEINTPKYKKVKEKQRNLEARIDKLKYIIKNADIYSYNEDEPLFIGSKFILEAIEDGEQMHYSIVNTKEVDSLNNKISDQSPLGKALLGRQAGDIVTVRVGDSISKYKIIKFEGVEKGYEFSGKKKKQPPKMKDEQENEQRAIIEKEIQPKDFLTRINVFKCSSGNHKLIDIKCRVKVLTNNGEVNFFTVPGAYCETCNKYYILESDFQNIKTKGILICKVVESEFWTHNDNYKDGYLNLNQESILHIMGYNVNAKNNLSDEQRWRLLEIIIDEGILTVVEVRSHLEWLMRRNANNHNFDDARIKWEKDSKYLLGYVSNKNIIDINSITNKKYNNVDDK